MVTRTVTPSHWPRKGWSLLERRRKKLYIVFKDRQWGLDRLFKYDEFVLVRGEAGIGTNSKYLKTRSSPNWRPLNDFSTSVLAQWISVLVMSVSINKPILWNYILSIKTWTIISSARAGKNSSSPLPSTSMVLQVCSHGAIQRVWLNYILMNYWWVRYFNFNNLNL